MRIDEQAKTVTFNQDERRIYGAVNYDGEEMMAVISGYDLDISFNMRLINSLADAEAAANALADVFYEALMEQLLAQKNTVAQQPDVHLPIPCKQTP